MEQNKLGNLIEGEEYLVLHEFVKKAKSSKQKRRTYCRNECGHYRERKFARKT